MEKCYFPADSENGSAKGDNVHIISERHRHRYEFNNDYKDILTGAGLVVSGQSPDKNLVETVEVPGLNFYLGVQYHPEFKSRPNKPHPLFFEFVRCASLL